MKFITIFDPKKELNFVGKFKYAGIVAILLPLFSLACLFLFGMPWGIDFLGGVEMQVKFEQAVSAGDVRAVLDDIDFDKNQVQQFGASDNYEMLIRVERMAALQKKDVEKIKELVKDNFSFNEKLLDIDSRVVYNEKLGSQVSIWLDKPYAEDTEKAEIIKENLETQKNELLNIMKNKSGLDLRRTSTTDTDEISYADAVLADEPQGGLVQYTVQFAGVSRKIKQALENSFGDVEIRRVDFVDSQVSRQLRTDGVIAILFALLAIVIYIAFRFDVFFSPGAIVALINDTMTALLVFVIGRVEFDTPSIAAMLTIVGYSINNTIVVYDRIRETVPHNPKKTLSVSELKPYVNRAINDTLSRTINTTLTTLFASIAIWIFATGVIESFAMVLTVGIIVGAFSSVFVAPMVYLLAKRYIKSHDDDELEGKKTAGHTREERAKGIV